MGNGSIQVSITLYPDNEGCKRYDQAITRTINLDHMGGLSEMQRVAYDMGSMVSSTIGAMLGTLEVRELAAKNPPLVEDDDEQAPEDGEVEYVIVVDNTAAA